METGIAPIKKSVKDDGKAKGKPKDKDKLDKGKGKEGASRVRTVARSDKALTTGGAQSFRDELA